jgi:hypothetical protein
MEEQWAIADFEEFRSPFEEDPMLAARITDCIIEGVDRRQVMGLTQKLCVVKEPEKESAESLAVFVLFLVVIGSSIQIIAYLYASLRYYRNEEERLSQKCERLERRTR